jgi:LysR family transcriptional regulator of abg operon
MRIPQLRHFIAAVDCGSVRAAARRVGITQPAMTKSLQQLERGLGVRLLVRGARGVALTPAGRAFLARARVVDAELRHAQNDLAALRGGVDGRPVAMGIGPALCIAVPQALAHFRARFPETQVRVVEGVRTALLGPLREEMLDFIIVQDPGGAREPGVRVRPLLRPELVVAGRCGHPLAQARSLGELAGASWLVFNPPGSGGMLDVAFRAAGLHAPRTRVVCESYATAIALLARSDLLGLIFRQVLDEPTAARLLHRFDIEQRIGAPSIAIFTRADTPLAPAAAAMAQAMTASLRALARSERTAT